MEIREDENGWQALFHEDYLTGEPTALVLVDTSVNTDYAEAFFRPGSSYLSFVTPAMHRLNREQVEDLAEYLIRWLRTARFDRPSNRRRKPRLGPLRGDGRRKMRLDVTRNRNRGNQPPKRDNKKESSMSENEKPDLLADLISKRQATNDCDVRRASRPRQKMRSRSVGRGGGEAGASPERSLGAGDSGRISAGQSTEETIGIARKELNDLIGLINRADDRFERVADVLYAHRFDPNVEQIRSELRGLLVDQGIEVDPHYADQRATHGERPGRALLNDDAREMR